MVEVGRIYRDKDNGGRLYIPKRVMEHLNFANREKVLIRVVSSDKLVIERFEEAVLEEG